MNQTTRGYFYAALSSASYGVNPLAVLLYNDGLSSDVVLFYRYVFAVVMLGALMLARGISFSLSFKELGVLAVMGMLFSLSSLGLFESYNYIGVSLASTILFTYPVLVAVMMFLFFHEVPSRLTLFALPIIFCGVVMLDFDGIMAGSFSSLWGIGIVVLSAVSYALYMVAVQKSSLRTMSSVKLGFYSLFFGSFLFLARLLYGSGVPMLQNSMQWGVVFALALFPSIVSLVTMAIAIRNVGSTSTAIMGALEPIVAILFGVLLFAERPSLLSCCGMLVILTTVSVIVVAPNVRRKKIGHIDV